MASGALKDKVKCAGGICKAWRFLRNVPELWTTIELPSFYRSSFDGHAILRLLGWLRDVSKVTSFKLDVGDRIPPDVTKKALAMMPGLTKLDLGGKKISSAVVAHFAKQPAAKNLESIALDSDCKVKLPDLLTLLATAPNLKSLRASNMSSSDIFTGSTVDDLELMALSMPKARNGGTPLLSSLDLTGGWRGCETPCSSFSKLGSRFPELEVLRLKGCSPPSLPPSFLDVWNSVVPMARLHTLSVGCLMKSSFFGPHLTTEELGNSVLGILSCCPRVEHLSLTHDTMWGGSKKNPREVGPLPSANGAFDGLPASLVTLSISHIFVTEEDFLDCQPTLPKLRRLSLRGCGPKANNVGEKLEASCPELKSVQVYG